MNYLDFWTEEEVDMICMYYGQIPENLQYNLKAILVEKFENEEKWALERQIEEQEKGEE